MYTHDYMYMYLYVLSHDLVEVALGERLHVARARLPSSLNWYVLVTIKIDTSVRPSKQLPTEWAGQQVR